MPFKISDPLYQEFELEKTDERYNPVGDDPTTVTIKQARQHEHARRMDQWNRFERKYSQMNPDEISIVQELSSEAIKTLEAWMTLVESNILKSDESGPLFPSKKGKNGHPELDMTRDEFEQAWGTLPPLVASEIHSKIIEVNPMWGGMRGE